MKNIKGSRYYVTFSDGFGTVIENCTSKEEVRNMEFSYIKNANVKINKIEKL